MAAPVANKIILPLDTGNTGKNVRTQTRVVGADTVHEHFQIPISARKIDGVYYFAATAAQAVQAAAQNGTTAAFFWLAVPTGSTKSVRLRRLEVIFEQGAAPTADHLTLPRIALQRFTFTGTGSGASIVTCKRKTADANPVSSLFTASTGMTVTLLASAIAMTFLPPGIDFATAVGQNVVSKVNEPYEPVLEDDFLELVAGEGFVLYQPDAGTATDVRRFNVKGSFDECDNS